jgi:CheY-like chemotaxis protein
MVEPQAQHHGIKLDFPLPDVANFVLADRTRLKQVLINLLSNAIKYNSRPGGVTVTYSSIAPGRMRVSIHDTGPGLQPGQLAQLFQAFNRLGQEAGGQEGTGIGLVVAKRLVELMGGAIGVESTVGEGSTFWFELHSSTEPDLAAATAGRAPTTPNPALGALRLRTLLYVEDNPANLALVQQIIGRHLEMRLITAVNGSLGIELALEHRPEVILMDINLPGINGFEVLKILRSEPATAQIPVIAISANAMPRDISKGEEAGFFRYLTKPIRVDELMDAVNAALELGRSHA